MSVVSKVLLVEDEPAVRLGCEQALRLAGLEVLSFESAERASQTLSADFPGIVLSDIKLPGMDGLSLLKHSMSVDPELPVVLVTGHGDVTMAVQAMREGAYDFIEKPFSSELLVEAARRALEKRKLILENRALRQKLANREGIETSILGNSPAIDQIRQLVSKLSDAMPDILILGETGSGKELLARALHEYSSCRQAKFVAVNCAALPESIFESEMFGHEPGAFTGATKRRIGKIEYAHGGTLFLDEIESMPLALQVKLLRVLQERKLERLGSNQLIPVNFRVIAATKENLNELSNQNKFRKDLYYRLNVVTIDLPSLRERREDIPLLFEYFVSQAAICYNRPAPIISAEQMQTLMAYTWPGNIRELRNIADRFVLGLLQGITPEENDHKSPSLAQQVDDFEKSLIKEELRRQNGRIATVSETLAIPKKTLYDKIRKYNLVIEAFRESELK